MVRTVNLNIENMLKTLERSDIALGLECAGAKDILVAFTLNGFEICPMEGRLTAKKTTKEATYKGEITPEGDDIQKVVLSDLAKSVYLVHTTHKNLPQGGMYLIQLKDYSIGH